MSDIHKHSHLLLNCFGIVGSIISGYISEYMTEQEIKNINKKIEILNSKIKDFDIFKYKIVNRIKIRDLIVKVLSEDDDIFLELSVGLLSLSEDNFENIIDGFMKLTKNDINVLYYNLWKKRNNKRFDIESIKKEISDNFEFTPDLVMSHAYRVNKEVFSKKENSLLIGDSLTLMPNLESSVVYNVFEKLAHNNFIKLTIYIPDITHDSFGTYICFNFTYLGIHVCKLMGKIEKNKMSHISNTHAN